MSKHCPCESCIYWGTVDCDYYREITDLKSEMVDLSQEIRELKDKDNNGKA